MQQSPSFGDARLIRNRRYSSLTLYSLADTCLPVDDSADLLISAARMTFTKLRLRANTTVTYLMLLTVLLSLALSEKKHDILMAMVPARG